MKKCKDCGNPRGHDDPMYSRCKPCQYAKAQLKRTPIAPGAPPKKIGQKRIERIKRNGSEYKVYVEMWKEAPDQDGKRACANCGEHIQLFDPSCFAHKLAKGANPKLRYKKENIAIVHGIWEQKNEKGETYQCHKEYDAKFRKGEVQ